MVLSKIMLCMQYQTQKSNCLDGEFGKTPQYWAKYMELVDCQRKLHFSININNYDLRMLIWKESLPLCFATNGVHYQGWREGGGAKYLGPRLVRGGG